MSAFKAIDGPARVGDESGEWKRARWVLRHWGIRERGLAEMRVASFSLAGGLVEEGISGEKGGDGGSAGEDSWRGEMGRLRERSGGVVDESGDAKPDEVGDMIGDDGPGEG